MILRIPVAPWRIATGLLVATLGAGVPGTWADGVLLEDGTVTNGWELPNQLHVVTRHVPEAKAVVITLSYRNGSADDPAGHEGLAELLAEIAFTGPTAEVPDRTREEMHRLRPLGWDLAVNPHLTLLTEACEPGQLPGVLHQVAARMQGLQVTSQLLRRSLAAIKGLREARNNEHFDVVLHHAIRDVFEGKDQPSLTRHATGSGLDGLGEEEIRGWLAERYVPANAVLAICGNLAEIDLERFTATEFGAIAAGAAARPPELPSFESRSLSWTYPTAPRALAALAVRAPALSDTSHPAFLLHTLIVGGYVSGAWGAPTPPQTSNYRYALLDDPDLVRFYPPVSSQTTDPSVADGEFERTISALRSSGLTDEIFVGMRENVGWILGGPLPAHLAPRLRYDLTLVADLTTSMASRPHFGDARFWAVYRERLSRVGPLDFMVWRQYLLDPSNRTTLLLMPKR